MSQCKIHPGREAVARCSHCGNPMCEDCVGLGQGPLICPDCQGITRSESKDAFWADASPHIRNEGRIDRYLLVGSIGSIFWGISYIGSIITSFLLISLPFDVFYTAYIPVSLILSIFSYLYAILIGIGFLGLYYKFDKISCKIAFYILILDLFFNLIGLNLTVSIFTDIYAYLFVNYAIAFAEVISEAVAIWQIKDHVTAPSIANLLIVGLLAMYPIFFMFGYILMVSYTFVILTYAFGIGVAILMTIFFYRERRFIHASRSKW